MKPGAHPGGKRAYPPCPQRDRDIRMGRRRVSASAPYRYGRERFRSRIRPCSTRETAWKTRNLCGAIVLTGDFILPPHLVANLPDITWTNARGADRLSGAGSTRLPCVCRGRGDRQGSGRDEEQIFWHQRGQRVHVLGARVKRWEPKLEFSPKEIGTDADGKNSHRRQGAGWLWLR